MTGVIFIRHGETDWNIEGRWQGQSDVPLNSCGRAQAAALARALAGRNITAIYSSDLSRASDTADAIAQATGLTTQLDRRLREIHQGAWQGQLAGDIKDLYAEEFRRHREDPLSVAPPGGETVLQVRERVLGAIRDIEHEHPGETVAVVSHGFVIALLYTIFRHLPIERVWELIPENGTWQELMTAN